MNSELLDFYQTREHNRKIVIVILSELTVKRELRLYDYENKKCHRFGWHFC